RLILAGGSGFLGHALALHFAAREYEVVVLSRAARSNGEGVREVAWDGRTLAAWSGELEGADTVVNLAGRSVDCRYTAKNRHEIIPSRVETRRVLGEAIARCERPPRVWLNASTATIYKHTFGEPWDESGETGATPEAKDLFSIEVASAWEG